MTPMGTLILLQCAEHIPVSTQSRGLGQDSNKPKIYKVSGSEILLWVHGPKYLWFNALVRYGTSACELYSNIAVSVGVNLNASKNLPVKCMYLNKITAI